jgi:DNA-binding protein H-NS
MRMRKKLNLDAMSVDEMWQLHDEIGRILSARLTSEKRELDKRLALLRGENELHQQEPPSNDAPRVRRKYPRVFPKYRNPKQPSELWSGRGKQPRWLAAALKAGHSIEEFVIDGAKLNKSKGRRRRT